MYNGFMSWNHAEFRIDGRPIIQLGQLAFVDLSKARGYYGCYNSKQSDRLKKGLENWNKIPEIWLQEFGIRPVTMIFDLDETECYYKIMLGELYFWINFKCVEGTESMPSGGETPATRAAEAMQCTSRHISQGSASAK